jgi:hypothetical protein
MVTLFLKQTGEVLYAVESFQETNEIGVTNIPCTVSTIKPYFNQQTQTYYEGATQQEVYEVKLENETQNYIKRTNDGVSAIAKFSAELRLAKLAGIITEDGHKAIDATLTPIRTEILAGQWISGKQLLEELGTSIIGQALYDRIYTEITTYIAGNY